MPDLLDELREFDPIRELNLPADGLGMRELRTAVLASPRSASSRRSSRWLGAGVAAAATLVAAVLLWPGLGQPPTVPAAPAASPSPSASARLGAWQQTAATPLSPRQGSVTAWADGTFFVIGGDEAPACSAAADCKWAAKPVRDGARYDPATDRWARIADTPMDVATSPANPYQRVVALDRVLYVAQGESVLAYDLVTDRWSMLPDPPAPLQSLFSVDGSLMGVTPPTTGDVRTSYLRYSAKHREWIQYAMEGEVPGPIEGATAVDGYLVLAGGSADASAGSGGSWVGRIKGFVGPVTIVDATKLDGQRRSPIAVQTRAGGYAAWVRDERLAYFYQPKSDAWSSVAQPDTQGALSGTVQGDVQRSWYLTVAGMIALNGHLYDPVAGLWSPTPALPVGAGDPVLASGDSSILACFGLTGEVFGTTCHLLRPAPASETEPA